jgi:hypothetical protein
MVGPVVFFIPEHENSRIDESTMEETRIDRMQEMVNKW